MTQFPPQGSIKFILLYLTVWNFSFQKYCSTMSNSWRHLSRRYHIAVTSTASARPVSLHLPHKKHETLHCLTSAPAWRGRRLLDLLGGGSAKIPRSRQSNKSKGWRRRRWWDGGRVRGKSPLRISGSEHRKGWGTVWIEKIYRHCNLSLRTHTQT